MTCLFCAILTNNSIFFRKCVCMYKLKPSWLCCDVDLPKAILKKGGVRCITRWRHQVETISALLALCEGNSPVIGGFPLQRASNTGFDVLFDVSLIKRLNNPSNRPWFETPGCSLWRHCIEYLHVRYILIHVCLQFLNSMVYILHYQGLHSFFFKDIPC